MRQIPIYGRVDGKDGAVVGFAMVDDEDFDLVMAYRWNKIKHGNTEYARAGVTIGRNKRGLVKMHRVVMNAPKGTEVDHIDHNGLNNQRSNLRIVTHAENMQNLSPQRRGKHQPLPLGVQRVGNKYSARRTYGGSRKHLGLFSTVEEAAQAYQSAFKG